MLSRSGDALRGRPLSARRTSRSSRTPPRARELSRYSANKPRVCECKRGRRVWQVGWVSSQVIRSHDPTRLPLRDARGRGCECYPRPRGLPLGCNRHWNSRASRLSATRQAATAHNAISNTIIHRPASPTLRQPTKPKQPSAGTEKLGWVGVGVGEGHTGRVNESTLRKQSVIVWGAQTLN